MRPSDAYIYVNIYIYNTYTYASVKYVNIGSDDGLSPERRQAIT